MTFHQALGILGRAQSLNDARERVKAIAMVSDFQRIVKKDDEEESLVSEQIGYVKGPLQGGKDYII